MITIDRPGPLTLVQDLGRPGLAHLGVSESGAADRAALRLANRLVGNAEDAAALEVTLGGLRLRTDRLAWCAVTGAATAVTARKSDGERETVLGSHRSLALRPGETLTIAPPATGLRNYLAVRGGLSAPRTLGSAATDLLSGLGPEPVRAGDTFTIATAELDLPDVGSVAPPRVSGELWLRSGPRRDWFTDASWQRLLAGPWRVGSESNRIGVRLEGPALERRIEGELASEGLLAGAIQVPPSGQPVIFGPDHPLTGGYPVIAVLTRDSCDRAGQLRGGATVALREITKG